MIRIPLKYRLPTPYTPKDNAWISRDQALSELARQMQLSRVLLISAPEGSGTTQLILRALEYERQRTIYINGTKYLSAEELLIEVTRTIVESTQLPIVRWEAICETFDSLIATTIDLIENYNLLIVVDNLDWRSASFLEKLVATLATYTRHGNWLFAGYYTPTFVGDSPLNNYHHRISAPSVEELQILGKKWRPDVTAEQLDDYIYVSKGHLRTLHELITKASFQETVNTLSKSQRRWLNILSVADYPVPESVLRSDIKTPSIQLIDVPEWSQLADKQMIVQLGDGWMITQECRDVWSNDQSEVERQIAIQDYCQLVEQCVLPEQLYERLRLYLATGKLRQAEELLNDHGDSLIIHGMTAQLWHLLDGIQRPKLQQWRLIAGSEYNHPSIYEEFAQQLHAVLQLSNTIRITDREDLKLFEIYLKILFKQGQYHRVIELSENYLINSDDKPAPSRKANHVDFQINYVYSSALLCVGRLDDAENHIRHQHTYDQATKVFRILRLADIYAHQQEYDQARTLSQAAQSDLATLKPAEVLRAGYDLIRIFTVLQDYYNAADVLETILTQLGNGALATYHGRHAILLQAIIAYQMGNLGQCLSILMRLEPYGKADIYSQLIVDLLTIQCRTFMGEFTGIESRLAEVFHKANEIRYADAAYDAQCFQLQLEILCALPVQNYPAIDNEPRESAYRELLRTLKSHHQLRCDCNSNIAALDQITTDNPYGRAYLPSLITLSQYAACLGQTQKSQSFFERAIKICQQRGLRLHHALTLYFYCENLVLFNTAHAFAQIRKYALELGNFAKTGQATFFAHESQFFEEISRTDRLPIMLLARLESLITRSDSMTPVARRAGWLMGLDTRCDDIDQNILNNIVSRLDWHRPRIVSARNVSDGYRWGIDNQSRSVWFEDGSIHSLKNFDILWRLLKYLATNGGYANKEDLVRDVWGIDDYHPLHHDNRLRLAASKLRKQLQNYNDGHHFIVAYDDGYKLDGIIRYHQ